MDNGQPTDEWLKVVRMTDDMRRYAELQQWNEIASLAVQRQAQLQLFFSKQNEMSAEKREKTVRDIQQLIEADSLLISAATEIKNAMAEGLTQINQGRKAVISYRNCIDLS